MITKDELEVLKGIQEDCHRHTENCEGCMAYVEQRNICAFKIEDGLPEEWQLDEIEKNIDVAETEFFDGLKRDIKEFIGRGEGGGNEEH